MMKLIWIMLVLVLLTNVCFSDSGQLAKDTETTLKPFDGAGALRKEGIKSASDIESAVVMVFDANAYKIAYDTDRKSVQRLYKVFDRIYYLAPIGWPWGPTGAWGDLILNLKSGKTIWFPFGFARVDENHNPEYAFFSKSLTAPDFPPFFCDLVRSPKAIALDGSVPYLDVDHIDVLPEHITDRSPKSISPGSQEGKALLNKTQAIIDCLDPRADFAAIVSQNDIINASTKFGVVSLVLKTPIKLDAYLFDGHKPSEIELVGLFRTGIQQKALECDKVYVMDFCNYYPPVIIMRDKSNQYYLFHTLNKKFVEGYIPGQNHEVPTGYKSPEDLYKELQELSKVAYEKRDIKSGK
ncbi:MAG: hypothetical protein ABFD54_17540 [Armatimonadota bacterium]|nr:hypothetical protein [bacterium]